MMNQTTSTPAPTSILKIQMKEHNKLTTSAKYLATVLKFTESAQHELFALIW